ncbi:AAA family ATPase [candidate division KSB1 bacterium]|nr:AAA family ATPase [candidate division KSB1 bacterium]
MSLVVRYSDLEGRIIDIELDKVHWEKARDRYFIVLISPKEAESDKNELENDAIETVEKKQHKVIGFEVEAGKSKLSPEASAKAFNRAKDLLDLDDPMQIKSVLQDWGYRLTIGPAALEANDYIEKHILAGYSLLYVLSYEEDRVINALAGIAEDKGLALYSWSFHKGVIDRNNKPSNIEIENPGQVIDWCMKNKEDAIYVLKDFHYFLDDPYIIRKIRDLVQKFKEKTRTVIFLSPINFIPEELERDITITFYPLPQFEELEALLTRVIEDLGVKENLVTPEEKQNKAIEDLLLQMERRSQLIQGCLGLTLLEAQNLFCKAIARNGGLFLDSISEIIEEKEQIIKKSGILEFHTSPENFSDIGGLENLKKWLNERTPSALESAWQLFIGLPTSLNGILLIGVPGCGKSLCAKAVAAEWKIPLLRLDLGRVFGAVVGESEGNMRKAISIAEAAAPCILWIDEIEKGFSTVWGGSTGITSRIFGTFLTWLQEKTSMVFVAATANDISNLPPEFLRKGRFDEIFFVNLPNAKEREGIFRIHLNKRKHNPDNFPTKEFAQLTDGFSGAEIEQIIISALYDAFDEKSPLTSELIKKNIYATIPLAKTSKREIEQIIKRGKMMSAKSASIQEKV